MQNTYIYIFFFSIYICLYFFSTNFNSIFLPTTINLSPDAITIQLALDLSNNKEQTSATRLNLESVETQVIYNKKLY